VATRIDTELNFTSFNSGNVPVANPSSFSGIRDLDRQGSAHDPCKPTEGLHWSAQQKVCRPGAYLAELRLPFDAALDAAEADLLREQNEGPERGRTAVANSLLFPLPPYSSVYRTPHRQVFIAAL